MPPIICYYWFGRNPLQELAKKYIVSWKRYLPDYECWLWNFNRFDINSSIGQLVKICD